jgi:sulfide dehydrogenase cytochrome subunit
LVCIALSAGLTIVTGASEADADSVPPTITIESCTTCHGPGGIGMDAIPRIAGLKASEMVESLQGFRDGTREATIMSRLVSPLSDEEISIIADYFASLGAPAQ